MPTSHSTAIAQATAPDDYWLLVQLSAFQLLLPRNQIVTLGPMDIRSNDPEQQGGSFVYDNNRYPAFALDANLRLQSAGENTCRNAILLQSEEHIFALACESVQRPEALPTRHHTLPNCMRGRRQPFERFVLIDDKPALFSSVEALARLLLQLNANLNASDTSGLRQETA